MQGKFGWIFRKCFSRYREVAWSRRVLDNIVVAVLFLTVLVDNTGDEGDNGGEGDGEEDHEPDGADDDILLLGGGFAIIIY